MIEADCVTKDNLSKQSILQVENLSTAFFTDKEVVRAIDNVNFEIKRGETVGIVGESGSGKSVTARSIMGLVKPPGRILDDSSVKYRYTPTVQQLAHRYSKKVVRVDQGEPLDDDAFIVVEEGTGSGRLLEVENGYVDLVKAPERVIHEIRGGDIAMVFQDPLTSLNPVYTVGNQIKEVLRIHQGLRGQTATEEAAELLEAVGIPDAKRRLREYPHQFSGGMRQRAVIANALACDPEVLIADEPTTALDVTIQAQILELLHDIQEERDLGIMFITHDMGVIAEIADWVNVMYAGEIIEKAPVDELFTSPAHPYTNGLLASLPSRNVGADLLATVEGEVPTPNTPPQSCRFAPRCPKAFNECTSVHPQHVDVGTKDKQHKAACLLYPENNPTAETVQLHQKMKSQESVRRTNEDGRIKGSNI